MINKEEILKQLQNGYVHSLRIYDTETHQWYKYELMDGFVIRTKINRNI